MKARVLLNRRVVVAVNAFAELAVWQIPQPVPGNIHHFKYRLAFVVDGVCILRYDNEAGKGGHKHIGEVETPYVFSTPAQLAADFWNDVRRWRGENESK